jgi:hypothetical protein
VVVPGVASAFETGRPSLTHSGKPPSRIRGEQALTVVVEDDRRAVADAQAGGHGGHPVGAHEQERIARLVGLDEVDPPVEMGRAGDVAARVNGRPAAVGPPARIDDPNPRPTQTLRQPIGGRQVLGSGQTTHRRYHTDRGRPVLT